MVDCTIMENIIKKLNELEDRLLGLKEVNYQKGYDEYHSITQLLERIIDRIYPEKDARQLKSKMYRRYGEEENQDDYLYDIDLAIRVINTIWGEYELFGFDDFKPLKEKVETEYQIGSEKLLGFFRKKKSN